MGSLGVVLLILGVVGIVLALHRRSRADLVIVPYVLVYYLYVSSWHELMDRYMLPIVPLLIILAVRACVALVGVSGVRRRALAFGVAAALLLGAIVLPAGATIRYSRSLSGIDVRSVAKAWIEQNVPRNAVIAIEPYGPPLVPRVTMPFYRAAGVAAASYHIVRLPLPLPGRDRLSDTALSYLLRRGVDYVVVSSDVYDRVLAARGTYPASGRLLRRARPARSPRADLHAHRRRAGPGAPALQAAGHTHGRLAAVCNTLTAAPARRPPACSAPVAWPAVT